MGSLVSHVQADGNGNMSSALIIMAPSLKFLCNRSLMLLSQTRKRLVLLPLATSPCISDAPCILYLSLYCHGCPNHIVHVLLEESYNITPDGQLQAILELPHLGHITISETRQFGEFGYIFKHINTSLFQLKELPSFCMPSRCREKLIHEELSELSPCHRLRVQ